MTNHGRLKSSPLCRKVCHVCLESYARVTDRMMQWWLVDLAPYTHFGITCVHEFVCKASFDV